MYLVQTRHHTQDFFPTLEEAQAHIDWLMEGYTEGLRSNSDPRPVLVKLTTISCTHVVDGQVIVERFDH